MIKIVYFDFGGVLTESGKKGFIGETLAKLYDVPLEQLDIADMHLALRRGVRSEQDLFDQLNEQFGKQVTIEDFVQAAAFCLTRSGAVYDLAVRLRDHGIRTGILSNVFAMNAKQLKRDGYYDGFEPQILSCDTGYAKPDPEFYDLAIQKAGVTANEILFVDDQDKCLPPALAKGMHVVQARSPEQIVADVTAVIQAENNVQL